MTALLDVNALIALIDPDHVSNHAIQSWFRKHAGRGWATCPLTENGAIRVLSQPAYPSGQRTPAEVIQVLRDLKTAFHSSHYFWTDDISLLDGSIFDEVLIAGTRQVTDVYLLGLVARHGGKLVSFDRSLSWHAVQGASSKLVEHPA